MSLAVRPSTCEPDQLPLSPSAQAHSNAARPNAAHSNAAHSNAVHSNAARSTAGRTKPSRPNAGCPQPLLKYPPKLRTLALPFGEDSPAQESRGAESDQAQASSVVASASSPPDSSPPASAPPPSPTLSAQQVLMAQLARDVRRLENSGRTSASHVEAQPGLQASRPSAMFSSGCSAIDDCLPAGGYAAGSVVEYLQRSVGSGATTLALITAREALARAKHRFCLVVDWKQQFFPPAAASLGIDLKRLVIVRPETLADRLWAIDQALRSPAIAAVVAQVERMDDRAARRVQLAAERGGGLALLVRGAAASEQPSWAEVQWLVRPVAAQSNHRQLQLELLRARGAQAGRTLQVQINATTARLEPVSAATAALARSLARTNSPHQPGIASGRVARDQPLEQTASCGHPVGVA